MLPTCSSCALTALLIAVAQAGDSLVISTLGGRCALLANRVGGQPLPDKEAPFLLLIAGDQRPSRWARNVVAVRVRAEPTP